VRVGKAGEQDFYLFLRDRGPASLTARFWARNLAPLLETKLSPISARATSFR
jgi:hypothetical protein